MAIGFAIKYNDVLLDVESGSNLTVEWFSTVFNEAELFRGSYSYPVDLKWSEKNLTALNFANKLENRLARISVVVSIIIFGHTWKNAIMEIDVEDQRLPATLLIDNSIISDTIKENTLLDMFSYFDGIEKKYSTIDMGTTEAQKRAHMLDTALYPGAYPYAFPSMTNFGLFGEKNLSGQAWVNGFNWEDPTITGAYQLYDNFFYCPSFYLVWMIKEICKKMGFEAIGSFLNHAEIQTWVIYNTGYYTGSEIKNNGFVIVPARHLPKITVSNFFKILRNDFKLFIYFDSLTKKAHFELPDRILEKENKMNFSPWMLDRSLKIKQVKDKAFLITVGIDDGDEIYKFLPYVKSKRVGLASDLKTTAIAVGAPFMNSGVFTGNLPSPLRNPQTMQTANIYDDSFAESTAFNKSGDISINEFTFRLFSFRGLLNNSTENAAWRLPYGTSDNRNALGVVHPNWISTNLNSENNWLEVFAAQFYKLLTVIETIEFNAQIPANRFSDVSPMEIYSIADKSGATTSFLPDRITFEPQKNNVTVYTRIKGYAFHKVFALLDPALLRISDYEVIKPGNIIYVAMRWVDHRAVIVSPTDYSYYAKAQFLFYSDPYLMNPITVSGLKVYFTNVIHYETGDVSNPHNITTDNNVSQYTWFETRIRYTFSGFVVDSEITVDDPGDESYVPIF